MSAVVLAQRAAPTADRSRARWRPRHDALISVSINTCASIASDALRYSLASQSLARCRYTRVDSIERAVTGLGLDRLERHSRLTRNRVRQVWRSS